MRAAFEASYRRQFSRLLPDIPVRIVSLRTAAIGRRPKFDLAALAPAPGLALEAARRGARPVWFAGGWRDAAIWSRLDLPVGAVVEGPAVLEQPDATTLVDPGLVAPRRRTRQSRSSRGAGHERGLGSRLLLCDLQNDFVHPHGAYGRAGQTAPEIAALPARLAPLADLVRARGGWIVSTHFTLVPGKGGEPIISPHLKALRPFLAKGDFLPGAWGHALVDELAPADLAVEKIAYSAFYMTRLEWVLRKAGIDKLYVAGIVTNGGVASTVARRACARSRSGLALRRLRGLLARRCMKPRSRHCGPYCRNDRRRGHGRAASMIIVLALFRNRSVERVGCP